MKLRSLALSLGAALLVPATLLAADAVAPATDKPAAEASAPASDASATEKLKVKPACEQLTGTRVKPRSSEPCLGSASPLKRFTEEEIRNTGEMNVSEALRKLDPNFR